MQIPQQFVFMPDMKCSDLFRILEGGAMQHVSCNCKEGCECNIFWLKVRTLDEAVEM